MKSLFFLLAICWICLQAQAAPLIGLNSTGWRFLCPTNGVDPATTDSDFNVTWYRPTTGGFVGGTYDGPAFSTEQNAPLSYGGVSALIGGTTLPTPPSGQRHAAYFYKVFHSDKEFGDLKLKLLCDDGAFVYLNGTLIARDNITDPDVFTKTATSLGSENSFDEIPLIGSPTVRAGWNLIAISVHQDNSSSSDLGFDLELNGNPVVASTEHAGWAMLSPINGGNGYDPATVDADFNSTWHKQSLGSYSGSTYDGPAFTQNLSGPFAYGGVDGIASPTAIPQPSSGTRGSAYFLKVIDGGSTGYDQVKLRLLADDGAYIYLNGQFIHRQGDLPAGAENDTWALETGADGSETTFQEVTLSGTQLLKPGPNLLALSLHNTNKTSSDLGFQLRLIGITPELPIILRGPYLQSGSHDRITLRWRTDQAGNSVVRYGTSPTELTQVATSNTLKTEHEMTLSGLTPNTKYFYQIATSNSLGEVNAGATADFYFKTYPTPGSKNPARLWVIGDSGTSDSNQANVYQAYRNRSGNRHTDVWLMLGDNAYGSGTDAEFQTAVFQAYPEMLRNTVMWSCIGNHETYTLSGQPYDEIHSFPKNGECGGIPSGSERYYSFDHGNIHFVCIDSQTSTNVNDVPGGGGMVDWLELDLQATDKDWIIAYFHHGPYTKGSHDSDVETQHILVRRYITPLLEKYGCDLVLSGHSHCYERSMLINGHHSNMSTNPSLSTAFAPANIINGGNGSTLGSVDSTGNFIQSGASGAYQKPLAQGNTGTIYSICGASGKLEAWDNGSNAVVNPAPHPVFIVNLLALGSLSIEIQGNSLRAQYLDHQNVIRDDFTILKGTTSRVEATDDAFGEFGEDDTATFRVSRTGATQFPEVISVQFSGPATLGNDFTAPLTTEIAFAAGESSKDITLTRVKDDLAEGPESLSLDLLPATQSAAAGATPHDRYFIEAPASATAHLLDNPSQDWWFQSFGSKSLSPSDWDLDQDHDGLSRLQEFAFGGSSTSQDQTLSPQLTLEPNQLCLKYYRNPILPNLSYQVEASENLIQWSGLDVTDQNDGPLTVNGLEPRKGISNSSPSRKFLRLKVQLLP